jgi:hypothetical protein
MPIERHPSHPLPANHVPSGRVECFQVADGDNWWTLADRSGMGVWELIEFNFKTRIPAEVNWYLRRNVGCHRTTRDRKNYVFSSSDRPGRIYYTVRIQPAPKPAQSLLRPSPPPTVTAVFSPIELTVIDDSDLVGWMASATRTGEIHMQDVESMVRHVKGRLFNAHGARQASLARLNILDHGNAGSIQIGHDIITVTTLSRYRTKLEELRDDFAPDGLVHLQHCNIGQNLPLLLDLAKIWGVVVYAGTGAHNPVYRFNWGSYVRCHPDGKCEKDVERP